MPTRSFGSMEDAYNALKIDYNRVVNRNIELGVEKKELEKQLRVLRKALAPIIHSLEHTPRQPAYFLRVNHPVVKRLYKVWRLTDEEEVDN